jgi:hypothetical protein
VYLWSTHPDLARGVVLSGLLYQVAQTTTSRAALAKSEPMIGVDATRFEGRFTIMPALRVDQQGQFRRYLAEGEVNGDRCPWDVAEDGASVVARDERTYGGGYDLWLAVVERWLISQGHVLSGFVRFYGEESWDRGIFTADGRLVLTRL